MLDPESEANSSSERRREPEHTSRAPRHDATTDDQTHRADPLPSRQTREGLAAPLPAPSPPGHRRRRQVRRCGAADTASLGSGLRPPARGEFEPFLGMRTRHPRSLTSPASHSTLLRSIITSLRLLVPLGMRISERRALLKRVSHAAEHRSRLRGAQPCIPYLARSPGFSRFDRLRVHSASNNRTRIPTDPLRSSHGHLVPDRQ
jgi:hypothetical protein